ncbi:MAG: ABC transporter permease [Thermoanaerobaculia bacterium]
MKEVTLVLEAGRAEQHYWRDLWRYRDLFLILAWRDVAVRYKQTFIGVAWAVLRPFLTMIVFTVVFGRLAKLPTDGNAPYALLVFAGMLPWTLFSSALTGAADSMLASSQLVGKVYFPRMIIPVATVVTALIDFVISLSILAAVMAWYRFAPGWQILLLPAFVILALVASIGPGLWISALNMKYRDFRYLLPFLVQIGLYVCPVGFSSSVIPAEYRLLYSINPMVGIIDGFRWSILGGASPLYLPGFALSLAVVVFFLWLGVSRFRATEKSFADLI